MNRKSQPLSDHPELLNSTTPSTEPRCRAIATLLFVALSLAACGGGGGGGGGGTIGPSANLPGNPSVLTAVAPLVPVSACPNGGIEVKAGIDENLNGVLDDPGEVDIIQYVCNGSDGTNGLNGISALVAVSDEPAGVNCTAGGKKVTSGPDIDGNGILDAGEVKTTNYVCNGASGTNGQDGISALIAVSDEPAGANCVAGGKKVSSGSDTNGNGILDADEVEATNYVCNGSDGTNGLNGVSALVAVSDEPAGVNCITGGKKVTSGPDTNGNGILDADEVKTTDYLCNGLNGTDGTDGTDGTNGANSLLSITSEPVGAHCASGGLKVVSWLDTIANGTLDGDETAFTNYVCNGPGTVVIQSITANPAVVRPGATTTLNVTATDGAGSTLTYLWAGAAGSFGAPTSASTSWTAPDTIGTYLVNVTISNGPATVTGYASLLVSAAPAGPVITSVSPAQVRAGDEVLISGGGFGAIQGTSTVTLGNVAANTIVSWSENQIRVIVPNGATTGAVLVTVGGSVSTPGYVVLPWNSGNNVAITTATKSQTEHQLASDGHGGAIIVWRDYRGTSYDIYAQRVNNAGTVLWTADGVAISTATGLQGSPQLVPDGSGGAIIAWYDYRGGAYSDIYAQRVSSTGAAQWTADGVAISIATGHQASPQLVPDGGGGAVIAWHDYRSGTYSDIYAQRVNSAGVVQWTFTPDGVPISTAANSQFNPQMVADGSGGAIIAWLDYRNGTNYDIYAQRVSSLGTVQWTTDGVAISTATGYKALHEVVPDGNGGAIIAWMDYRSGTGADIYAQRVNSAGAVQWTANGAPIVTAAYDQYSPQLVPDGGGGAIIVWQDQRSLNAMDIYAQRVNGAGAAQWAADGVAISTATTSVYAPQLVPDGRGGAIIAWYDYLDADYADIYAQRVNGGGSLEWNLTLGGVPISTATGQQRTPRIASDGSGGAIIVWEDYRNDSSNTYTDLYAQGVSADGTH